MSITAFSFARAANEAVLQKAGIQQLDEIPEGFNNSIRWNVGHVIVVADRVLSLSEQHTSVVPVDYFTLFDKGTNPTSWEGDIPSVDEMLIVSKQQLEATKTLYETHGTSSLAKPFLLRETRFDTVSECLAFLAFHEGMHYEKSKILFTQTR